ncbi:type II toxin-antitoxin system death-on-curing family toxin [Streptomyces gardneri]|uniref:Toxin Doc n=1 Tax=Streptomyces gardneri TaxID=66892 RepID=A0A4Y3RTV1_9ACTN|nr:type II toxin-antitoxin system death-on-curing family toxin [Streptomyces gardneri]GEB59340.1 toxin Doc [Streptomyces gardneri]GHG80705.1 toxin Doc [Streptomyces gardneri]
MTCVYLSAEDVVGIARSARGHALLVHDLGLVAEAAYRPSSAHSGKDVYPSVVEKAAALLQSLAYRRPFVDRNKRTAWLSCVTFLAMNGVQLRPDIDAAERLVVAVATGETDEVEVIARGLRELISSDVS